MLESLSEELGGLPLRWLVVDQLKKKKKKRSGSVRRFVIFKSFTYIKRHMM